MIKVIKVRMRDCYGRGSVLWPERRIAPRKGYEVWWTSVSIATVHSGTVEDVVGRGPSKSLSISG